MWRGSTIVQFTVWLDLIVGWICDESIHDKSYKQLLNFLTKIAEHKVSCLFVFCDIASLKHRVSTIYANHNPAVFILHYYKCSSPVGYAYSVRHSLVCAYDTRSNPVLALERWRIIPPWFLAECRIRQLNEGSFVLLSFALFAFSGLCLVCK